MGSQAATAGGEQTNHVYRFNRESRKTAEQVLLTLESAQIFTMHSSGIRGTPRSPTIDWQSSHVSMTTSVDGPPISPTSAHRAGFRDCGLIALRYLTDVACLDPREPIVAGVRRIVERGSRELKHGQRRQRRRRLRYPEPSAAATTRRRQLRNQENMKPTACDATSLNAMPLEETNNDFRRSGSASSGENVAVSRIGRSVLGDIRQMAPPSIHRQSAAGTTFPDHRTVDGATSETSECARFPYDVDETSGGHQRIRHGLRSTRFDSDLAITSETCDYHFGQEVTRGISNALSTSDLFQVTDVLDRLARRDSRVGLILTELMDLMDDESNDLIEV